MPGRKLVCNIRVRNDASKKKEHLERGWGMESYKRPAILVVTKDIEAITWTRNSSGCGGFHFGKRLKIETNTPPTY